MKRKFTCMILGLSLLFSMGYPSKAVAEQQKGEENTTVQESLDSTDIEKTQESTQNGEVDTLFSDTINQEQDGLPEKIEPSDEVEVSTEESEIRSTQMEEISPTIAVQSGNYTIYSAGNPAVLLTIKGRSKNNSAQLELNRQQYHGSEQFEFIPAEGTWFIIKNIHSGLVLDVAGGSAANGANVQQHVQNNTDAQKWQFIDAGNGYVYIQSKLGTVLDCPSGNMAVGTKIQTYKLNNSNAQKWRLALTEEPVLKEIPIGTYQMTGSGTDKVFSLNDLIRNNNAKVALHASSYNKASEFTLEKTADNWYYLVNTYSQKVVDIAGGSATDNAVVQQYTKNTSDAQKFRFIDAGDGYVYIQSKLGTVLDRAGGGNSDGTKIQTYGLNYSNAQKWKVERPIEPQTVSIQEGIRYFVSTNIDTNRVLEVSGGSTASGGNVKLWVEDAVKQQKFTIQSADTGWYKLVNEKSGKVLDVAGGSVANGANVQQYTWNNSDAQKFRFINAGNGLTYIQSKLGTYLDIAGGQNKNGANAQMYRLNRSNAQKFRLDALNKGNYIRTTILNKTSARVSVFNPTVTASSMKFPTWSRNKGQDDLKWLDGSKSYDGSWTVVVKSSAFHDGGVYDTHVYANGNKFLGGTSYTLEKIVQDGTADRLAKPPYYYSQLDGRWSSLSFGISKLGPSGCVPTSMAMVLRGSYGINVSPIDTANRIYSYGGFNQQYFGASATDLFRGIQSYGRSISKINSLNSLNDTLSKGYPVIMFVDVGIGHAIVAHNYSNGKTLISDPYGRQFYNGWVSTAQLWNSPSKDSIDWTQGRPYFVIK